MIGQAGGGDALNLCVGGGGEWRGVIVRLGIVRRWERRC
jgi:hypothetical protein